MNQQELMEQPKAKLAKLTQPPLETATDDGFFAALDNIKPFLKAAFEGFAGSGKTFTAALIAVGLYLRIGSTKPVVIFDTEMAAKFLRPIFEKANIPVVVKVSRSLADLKETMRRCKEGYSDILLIDSISHVWENFLDAYKQKVKRSRLEFQDWGIIKPAWKTEFSDPLVRDPYHILMTGRAGYEYENEKNAETGKREIYKSGIKMKVEGETAYEPDMLVLMERFEKVLGEQKEVWREATVLKDRSDLIDGKTFRDPSYKDFEVAIESLLVNPKTLDVAERDAAALFKTEEAKAEWNKQRDAILEEIENYLVKVFPGQSAEAKKLKVEALEHAYGTASWTKIKGMYPPVLEEKFPKLSEFVAKKIAEKGME